MPVGTTSGRHALVVGATGSGKTVTQAFIAGRLIRAGHGAVVIDPKGDRLLRDELEHAARTARRTLRVWTPDGPGVYNPFAHGTDTRRSRPTARRQASWIYEAVRAGTLPCLRIGRHIRFTRTMLEDLATEQGGETRRWPTRSTG